VYSTILQGPGQPVHRQTTYPQTKVNIGVLDHSPGADPANQYTDNLLYAIH